MSFKITKWKKILSIFLSLAIFLTMTPELALTVFANEFEKEYYSSTDSSGAPDDYEPISSAEEFSLSALNTFSDDVSQSKTQVLLIEDTLPWSTNVNSELLNMLDISFKKVQTSEFLSQDLGNFSVIVFANDQQFSTYNNYSTFREQIEMFAELGGVVLFGACDGGWAKGNITSELPGGVTKYRAYESKNYIVDNEHPIITGELSDNVSLTDNLLYGNYCSHVYFDEETLPENANIILRDTSKNAPTLVEFPYGRGHIILSGQTWEHNYVHENAFSRQSMDDLFLYAVSIANIDVNSMPPIAVSVDAPKELEVVGNRYTPNPITVKAFLKNISENVVENVKVEIVLPSGLSLVKNSSKSVDIGTMLPEQSKEASWEVNASAVKSDTYYQYEIIVTAADGYQRTVTKTLYVPELEKEEFEYTLFSGSNTKDLSFYGWKSNIDGNIYTGSNFKYGGSEFYVDGRIDAVGSITTDGWKTEVTERNENVTALEMPNFEKAILENAQPCEYFEESPAYIQDRNVVNSSFITDGDVVISGTSFEGDCYIIANGDITYNVQNFETTGRVLLYSRNGNITINGSQININGAMYAPNGTVAFNTYDTSVTGFICADSINYSGSIFNISGANFDMVTSNGIIKTYTTDSDFNEGVLSGVSLAVPDQLILAERDSESYTSIEKIYGDTESGKGIKISYNSDKSTLSEGNNSLSIGYDLSGFGDADINENAVDLIIVVDESGSMSGSRMTNTKNAAREIVSQMKESDRCAIIGFTTSSIIRQNLTSDKALLESAINNLRANGGTYIYSGINSAISMFNDMSNDDRQKFIILISDGEDGATAQSLAAAANAGEKGIRIFAMMIGTGTLQMQNIAINSNGIYKNAPTSDDIGKIMSYFAEEVFNVAGRNTTFKTTIKDKNTVNLSEIAPAPTSITENPDNSVTLEWSFDRITIDEIKAIAIPVTVSNAESGFVDIFENTSCVYYDRNGKPHVIYLDDISMPVSRYAENGKWSVVFDSERENTDWAKIYWNGVRYGDGRINVFAAVSDDGETFGETVQISNFGEISELVGRYIKLDVDMQLSSDGKTPELHDITIMSDDADDIVEYKNDKPNVEIAVKSNAKVNIPINLRAVISDDLAGSDISVKWSSENESISFTDSEALITTATVSKAGNCDIVCTVSDGENITQAICIINIDPQDKYEDIDPDKEEAAAPNISVNIPEYADRGQKINAKIENLNSTEISWYSVIFRGNTPINVSDDGSFSLTMPNSNGTYHLVVRAFDWAGNSDVKEFDIIVDSSVPNIEITPSAESVNVGELAYFTVVTSVASKIASVKYTLNGEEVALNESGIYPLYTSKAGVYELCAEAITVSGKTIYTSATITVVNVDITAPSLGVKISWIGEIPYVNYPVTIEITAEDDSGKVFTQISVNGEVISSNENMVEFIPKAKGDYLIYIKAFDEAGNLTDYEYTLVVSEKPDIYPPTGKVHFNTVNAAVGEEIIATVEAEDDSGTVYITASINGVPVDVSDNTIKYIALEEGIYTFEIIISDPSGNTASLTQNVTVIEIDRTAPTLNVSGIPASIIVGETIYISAEAYDDSGEAYLTAVINGEEIDISDGNAEFTPDTVGECIITITATDKSGNYVTHEYTVVVLESDIPQDIYPPTGHVIFNKVNVAVGEEIVAAIEAEDDSGEVFIDVTINGIQIEVIDDTVRYIPEEEGIYVFEIILSDAAGNTASLTQNVTASAIDVTAPVLTVSGIPASLPLGQTIEIFAEAYDESSEVHLSAVINGTEMDISKGTLSYTPDTIGECVIIITATDDSGNSVSYEYAVNVYDDSEGPDIYPPIGSIKFNKLTVEVGEEITAQITAFDNSGKVLISATVNGIPLDVEKNKISFIPDKEGVYAFEVILSDEAGNHTVLTQNVMVISSYISSILELYVSQIPDTLPLGQDMAINIENLDDSIDISVSINGIELVFINKIAEYTFDTLGEHTIVMSATDSKGAEWSYSKTVLVVEPYEDVTPPEITMISYLTAVAVGEEARIEFSVTDDSGEVFVKVTVNGEEIPYIDGVASFVPDQVGYYEIEISALDAAGNGQIVNTVIIATENKPAINITGIYPEMRVGDVSVISVSAFEGIDDITVTATVNGEPIEVNGNTFIFAPDKAGVYSFLITATALTGNYIERKIEIYVSEAIENEDGRPFVEIYINDGTNIAEFGKPVNIHVFASDPDGIETVELTVNGETVQLDENRNAVFNPEKIGRYTVKAKVIDSFGNETIKELYVKVVDSKDQSVCEVAIISPVDNAVITAPTEIFGEIKGDNLVYYSLEYCPEGETEFTEMAWGESVTDGSIMAVFDPTLFNNGYYTVRLVAHGSVNNSYDEITVSVEGQMKIGNYSIAFQDMDIPVTGYPLTVIRSYDSRDKAKNGDFGYGWDMKLSTITLHESCAPGKYWSQKAAASGMATKYYFVEDRIHEISVDYGNGQVEKFKVKLSPDQNNFYPIKYDISVSYEAQGNTKSKLEAIGTNTGLVYNGDTLYLSNMTPYSPTKYKLTRADGTVYIISAKNGVESITDTYGNIITFTEKGVTHSDGKSITFERDSDGRVTKITGPTGKIVTYTYDLKGNLSYVTDEAEEITTFKYDDNHYLTDIIDSRGVKIARNEYDNDGRLIATVDANGNRLEFDHDIDGRRDVVTDRLGNSTLYIYDDRGNVISETDALGNTILSTYDNYGNLKTKTDPLGNITTYNYDAQGNLLSLTNALGQTVTNEYNEKGQLTSIKSMGVTQFIVNYNEFNSVTSTVDSMGNSINYEYDNKSRVTSVSDEIGTYIKMTYDSNGNVVSAVNGAGETATFTYDSEGNCISKTITRVSSSGNETLTEQYAYDVYGNLTKVIYADGSITNVEYDSVGNMTASVDSIGRRTAYKYDLFGNLLKITYCDNSTETFEYDKEGRNVKATDRLGRSVEMTYDAVGNLISKIYPNGSKVSYTYDAKYRLVSVTGANGGVTSYEYDVLDRNTAITDALGNRTEFGYSTANGQLETMTDAKGNTYTYGYDLNGNRTSVTMPDGTSVTTAYDARGRVISQTDQYGHTTKYTYDGANRLTSVTDTLESTWKYSYNSVGELVSVTDANGNTTRYEYDNAGRVIKTVNASGNVATVDYDKAGNILTSTDYAGNVTSYTYDNLDRVTSKTVGKDTVLYTYTADGLLSNVIDKNGTVSYVYDIMNGLKSVTLYDGKTIDYTYDDACRLTEVETPFGTTQYEYDLMDRLIRVVAHDGTATLYEYDVNGNRTAVKYANGIVVTYEYDKLNRLVREKAIDKNGAPVVEYTYTLGAAGERLKVEETGRTVEYEYDEAYRLTKETVTDGSGTTVTEYTYDKNSNRLTKTVDGAVTSYAYNELNQLVSETGISYEYDLNGNLVKKTEGKQTTTYTYNAQNRLIRVTVQSGQQVNVEEYRYDYAGNRIAKVTELGTINYLVDTNGALSQVLAEYDENGSLKTHYTRGEELISQERNGVKSYYLYDGFDSVRMLTDDEGNVTDTYTFDAFGNLTDSTGDTENSYLYRGEQFDSFTGLYYLRARYMNPSTGTFITMDEYAGSVFEPVSLHKYLYANANPVMFSDPSGYTSLSEMNVTSSIISKLHSVLVPNFSNVMKWINFFSGFFDTLNQISQMLQNGATLADIADTMLRGLMSSFLLNNMCMIKGIGPIISKFLIVYGFYVQFDALEEAIEEGDILSSILISLQLVTDTYALGDSCFTGDTLVAVEGGQKRIDEIEIGDKVWAYNIETGETELKAVTKVYVHSVDEILHLYTDEGTIDTTTNHPFYVIGEGWVAAGDLEVGDEVYNLDGTTSIILGSEIEVLDEPVLVYNLEVEDLHSYFVGCVPCLVHNYNNNNPFDNPVPIENRKSTGRTEANTFEEMIAMQIVKSDPLAVGKEIHKIADPTWSEDGWVKMACNISFSNKTQVEIHFNYNKILGLFDDFKFK